MYFIPTSPGRVAAAYEGEERMESTSGRKRSFDDLATSDPPPAERRVRFPKGKKPTRAGERLPVGADESEALPSRADASVAATERAKRRNRMIEEEVVGVQHHSGSFEEILRRSEVNYEENASFDDDGIQIEPFNLDHEREEGYFDESGNYVEYVRNDEIRDAWLDSVDAEAKFVEQKPVTTDTNVDDDYQDLSTTEIGKIKRNIANALEPGETVMQALRRLKGSGDKKKKMSEETKHLFDLLTESAMKLMENGEYNVYHEERETFVREAEGYERLAHAKEGSSNRNHEPVTEQPPFPEDRKIQEHYTSVLDTVFTSSEINSTHVTSGDAGNEIDMFGDDDDDDENKEKASASSNTDLHGEVTIIAAIWVAIMIRGQDYIALLRQENGMLTMNKRLLTTKSRARTLLLHLHLHLHLRLRLHLHP